MERNGFQDVEGRKLRLQVNQIMQPQDQDALEFWLTNEKLRKTNHKLATKGELLELNVTLIVLV